MVLIIIEVTQNLEYLQPPAIPQLLIIYKKNNFLYLYPLPHIFCFFSKRNRTHLKLRFYWTTIDIKLDKFTL